MNRVPLCGSTEPRASTLDAATGRGRRDAIAGRDDVLRRARLGAAPGSVAVGVVLARSEGARAVLGHDGAIAATGVVRDLTRVTAGVDRATVARSLAGVDRSLARIPFHRAG